MSEVKIQLNFRLGTNYIAEFRYSVFQFSIRRNTAGKQKPQSPDKVIFLL